MHALAKFSATELIPLPWGPPIIQVKLFVTVNFLHYYVIVYYRKFFALQVSRWLRHECRSRLHRSCPWGGIATGSLHYRPANWCSHQSCGHNRSLGYPEDRDKEGSTLHSRPTWRSIYCRVRPAGVVDI